MPDTNEQAAQADTAQLRGYGRKQTPKPAGLLPKKTQQLVILGVGVVMVLIMWLTGNTKRVSTSTAAASRNPSAASEPGHSRRLQANDPATTGSQAATHFIVQSRTASDHETRRRRARWDRCAAGGHQYS